MSCNVRLSLSVTKLMATPLRPKRPPRPILQTQSIHVILNTGHFSDIKINGVALPMNIILAIRRQIIVNDQRNLLHIDATGQQISCYQYS